MILYHGSNLEIMEIDFAKCKPYKDFGKGFYLTSLKTQAIRMAQNKAALFGGAAIVTVYEIDAHIFDSEALHIRKFAMQPTIEWARFVGQIFRGLFLITLIQSERVHDCVPLRALLDFLQGSRHRHKAVSSIREQHVIRQDDFTVR